MCPRKGLGFPARGWPGGWVWPRKTTDVHLHVHVRGCVYAISFAYAEVTFRALEVDVLFLAKLYLPV